jgi:hypothetical protein
VRPTSRECRDAPGLRVPRIVASLGVATALLLGTSRAEALSTQMVVFLNSSQPIATGWPDLSLFAFYYARPDVNVLGVYAGPRWKWGDFGLEVKTGAYGGGSQEAKAIVNMQLDYSRPWLSLTSFTDYYPLTQIYSYASAFGIIGNILFIGALGDFTYDWGPTPVTQLQGGPSLGAGTKKAYLAVSYLFRNDDTQWIRLTVGLTL